jgi:spore germination cell wall hydrolase CwlJ-like protein
MLHVAQVIVNRAYPGQMMPRSLDRDGGLKLRDVILKPLQFSCFNTSDPNREKLLEAHKLDAISWGQAVAISELVIGGHALDPTLGSVNYLTKELYESDAAPKWAKSMRVMVKHGNHVFGRA